MPTQLREWLTFPVRTRTRAALSAAAVALLAFAAWHGFRALRFQRDQAAAKEALARYDFPEARRRLASCLEVKPGDPAVLLLAAQAARRDGLLDEAEGYLDRYGEQTGDPGPEGALQDILLRVQRGMVKQYVHTLIEYVEIRHPESEQILEALALGSAHVYRLDEASFWTKQLLDRFPDNPPGRLLHAQTQKTLGRPDRSAQIARLLVKDYPENDRARLLLADLQFKMREYEDAAEHFRELRRRQPGALAPLLGLARVLLALEQFDEVKPLLRELEEEHGDNSEALLTCARSALLQNRPADAEPILRRALRIAPYDHEVHYELAVCLGQLNRTDESRRHLERYKRIQADHAALDAAFQEMVKAPSDPAPRLEAGRICLRNGQVAEGIRWLSGVLDLVPDHKPTHKLLADHYASAGDTARAEYHRARAQ